MQRAVAALAIVVLTASCTADRHTTAPGPSTTIPTTPYDPGVEEPRMFIFEGYTNGDDPRFSVAPDVVQPGDRVTVAGQCRVPAPTHVELDVPNKVGYSGTLDYTKVDAPVDSDGRYSYEFQIPIDLRPPGRETLNWVEDQTCTGLKTTIEFRYPGRWSGPVMAFTRPDPRGRINVEPADPRPGDHITVAANCGHKQPFTRPGADDDSWHAGVRFGVGQTPSTTPAAPPDPYPRIAAEPIDDRGTVRATLRLLDRDLPQAVTVRCPPNSLYTELERVFFDRPPSPN